MFRRAQAWLLKQQNQDGGWGSETSTPSSIEETALALDALANCGDDVVLKRGVDFLIKHTKNGTSFPTTPIGFYFAKLWYFEKLYPIIWTVSALERVKSVLVQSIVSDKKQK